MDKPLANASVEVHESGQPDRRIPANAAGEDAFTISSTARCDRFVTTGKLSAYRLGFRPGSAGAQKLDWTLAETGSAVPGSAGIPAGGNVPRQLAGRDAGAPGAQFPAGTVITNMLTDETGAFDFPNLKPGAYQLRAHVLGGKTWFDGGKIIHVRSEMPEADTALLRDAQGRLWLASPPDGLTRVGAGDPEVFGTAQGLPTNNSLAGGERTVFTPDALWSGRRQIVDWNFGRRAGGVSRREISPGASTGTGVD